MKTNQEMTVHIGNNYTIKIGHLTKMGKLSDVFTIGNNYREDEGLRAFSVTEWLRKENVWEFIHEVERKYGAKFQNVDSTLCLSEYKNRSGQIDYSKLTKQFSVIKSQRGGKPENRGVWANLFILLKASAFLSPKLELEIYEIFINSKILEWRDSGGDNYILLKKAIDTLPDRENKNNKGVYIQIAKQFREKLDLLDTKGYNIKEAIADIQEKRTDWERSLIVMIETELITSYQQLKLILGKLK
jgi:hypothetical protein